MDVRCSHLTYAYSFHAYFYARENKESAEMLVHQCMLLSLMEPHLSLVR